MIVVFKIVRDVEKLKRLPALNDPQYNCYNSDYKKKVNDGPYAVGEESNGPAYD